MPIFQKIIKTTDRLPGPIWRPSSDRDDIRALIISPTRELAEQIAAEARKAAPSSGIVVQLAVGGTQKKLNQMLYRRQGCNILVGTPGRLKDLLSDPYSGIKAPNLEILVLDEADRLLDQGFGPEIQELERLLPDKRKVDRQTLMFSATVPREVMHMVQKFMKPSYSYVNTVQDGEPQTHDRVPQKIHELCGLENFMPALLELIRREVQRNGRFKGIVFFNTAAEAVLARHIYAETKASQEFKFRALDIHSRLTQSARTRSADNFRSIQSGIMFASDVIGRGMDFPDVTHVIQMGPPRKRDDYVHRIGRTARGDKDGEAWMFSTAFEWNLATEKMRGFTLTRDDSLECAKVDMSKDARLSPEVAQNLSDFMNAAKQTEEDLKTKAYLSTFGSFNGASDKETFVKMMNRRAHYGWGMEKPPQMPVSLAQKIGFARVAGLNFSRTETPPSYANRDGSAPRVSRFSPGTDRSGHARNNSPYGDRGGYEGRGSSFQPTGDQSGYGRRSDRFPSNGDRGGYERHSDRFPSMGDRGGYQRHSGGLSSSTDRGGPRSRTVSGRPAEEPERWQVRMANRRARQKDRGTSQWIN